MSFPSICYDTAYFAVSFLPSLAFFLLAPLLFPVPIPRLVLASFLLALVSLLHSLLSLPFPFIQSVRFISALSFFFLRLVLSFLYFVPTFLLQLLVMQRHYFFSYSLFLFTTCARASCTVIIPPVCSTVFRLFF